MTEVTGHPHSSFSDGQKASRPFAAVGSPKSPLPLHNAELAMSRADDLSARVIALADRLIGSLPENTGEGIQDMPAGALPQLSRKADAAISSINKAFAALDRLEGQL